MRHLFPTLLFLLFAVLTSYAQLPTFEKLEAGLWERFDATDEPLEVIVLVKNKTKKELNIPSGSKVQRAESVFQQLQYQSKSSQQAIQTWLTQEEKSYRSLYILNALLVKADRNLLRTLSYRSDVEKIIYNVPVPMQTVETNSGEIEMRNVIEWGIKNIKADEVWNLGFRGDKAVVGGQDTGYEWEHPALIDQYRGNRVDVIDHNYNWHDAIHEINPLNDTINDANLNPCGLDVLFPCDDNNHGTHTMGTAVGEASDNQIGVAPEAEWIGCRNMERGYGTPFTYLECFEWFLAPTNLRNENPRPDLAPHVIVNSWGCPEIEGCSPDNFALLQAAIKNLRASGVVVVVSAGNSGARGCGSVNTPAAIYEESFSIGAIQQNDTIANFSSRGPVTVDGSNRAKPNVAAPGVGVRSAIRNDGYASFSGTSMAGPHVAGAVALMINANPELAGQVEVIESILEETAIPMMPELICNPNMETRELNYSYGHGRIDALAAVEAALTLSNTNTVSSTNAYTLFPNPTNGIVQLRASDTKRRIVRLYHSNGQFVSAQIWEQSDQLTLDLRNLTSGLYICQIQEGDQVFYEKVVRE